MSRHMHEVELLLQFFLICFLLWNERKLNREWAKRIRRRGTSSVIVNAPEAEVTFYRLWAVDSNCEPEHKLFTSVTESFYDD